MNKANQTNSYLLLKLLSAEGVGPVMVNKFLEKIRKESISLSAAFSNNGDVLNEHFKKPQSEEILSVNTKLEEMFNQLQNANIGILSVMDRDYPTILSEGLSHNAPPVLFHKGNLELLQDSAVGFCGSRKASDKGLSTTRSCAEQLVKEDIVIVSGHANGVDLETHHTALSNGGKTILVIPEGIFKFKIKPQLQKVWDWKRVLVLSEFMPDDQWTAGRAMQRNKTIIGLSKAMILIEAGETGGSMDAGKRTLGMKRKLFAPVYEGMPETAVGNRILLERGALPILKSKSNGHANITNILDEIKSKVTYKASVPKQKHIEMVRETQNKSATSSGAKSPHKAINDYYSKLDLYKRYGGTRNESSIRRAFANLLEEYCLPRHLILVDELTLKRSPKRPDGTVKDALQLDWGHWESKDPKDNIFAEMISKFELGYPQFNIIFENSEYIYLIQEGQEVMKGYMNDADFLDRLLTTFVEYERLEIKDFHNAIEKFKEDIPDIVEALRSMISDEAEANPQFKKAREEFWEMCKNSINPEITSFDIREMLIQHILTAEIFDTVFGDSHFHRENNIAKELEKVTETFFTGAARRNTLNKIDSYYRTIKREASNIENHHEKQKFLKVVYENFYKAYNPKGADKLGIVYTPNEIVDFMIESTDYLLEKHFGKSLSDKNVEIMDPATGTGTFITDIIEYIPPQYLEYKYKNELHANELAILPYYIANLNIEYTYHQKMGKYEPFENIVFVDTLDNVQAFEHTLKDKIAGLKHTAGLFSMSKENIDRINRQNERKISVIIGNPPYNANQMNENDNNKNRTYRVIDKRIKDTYIKESTAQKTKLYDMYARFLRWASDRVDKNGIIAFITNRSYIDSRTFDGFRKVVADEFDYLYIVDTRSDVRNNPKISGTKNNVFGIQTGVAIMFLVKKEQKEKRTAQINYTTMTDEMLRREKLLWFAENSIKSINFETIEPDQNHNWLNITDNDFDTFLPVVDRKAKKKGKSLAVESVFSLYTGGIKTNRDEWVYDDSRETLNKKISFFIEIYNEDVSKLSSLGSIPEINDKINYSIKWSRDLKNQLLRGNQVKLDVKKFITSEYRPFCKRNFFSDYILNDVLTGNHFEIFGFDLQKTNKVINISGTSPMKPHQIFSTGIASDYEFVEKNQYIPLYRYDNNGNSIENITDWGLKQFTDHYGNENITKEDIFHYTYGVLHNPAYRKKYEINLKREFPRLPFYKDFYKWVNWGKELMALHINYEEVEQYKLKQVEEDKQKDNPKAKLKAIPEEGRIILDDNTSLEGIPSSAWEYTLGNRSALHWILDQYKEKTPKDPTIREKFNTYKFADYKEQVIDLLKRVCTVSVKTMEIVNRMAEEEGHE